MSKVVFPKPAGAEIKVSLRPASRSRVAISRGRATEAGRAWEGRSLVNTSESDERDTWLTSGAHSTCDRPLFAIPGELSVVQTTVVQRSSCSSPSGVADHLFDHVSVGGPGSCEGVNRATQERESAFYGGVWGYLRT